jgi:hypothetical protein
LHSDSCLGSRNEEGKLDKTSNTSGDGAEMLREGRMRRSGTDRDTDLEICRENYLGRLEVEIQ